MHPSSVLEGDEYGKLPMYVVYHELINTTSPFMRNVCAVEPSWVKPVLTKLESLDINKLRYGICGSKRIFLIRQFMHATVVSSNISLQWWFELIKRSRISRGKANKLSNESSGS